MDKRFRILVVDDETVNIKVISSAFQGEYDVLTALNGHDAISQLKEIKPDLILLDVMMPDVNGFDVCKIIKANPLYADIPVIFLTAMNTHEGAHQGLAFGGIDYLAKPVANTELIRAVEAIFRRSQRRSKREFKPDFTSVEPLLKFKLTPRAAETLLWLAQGKTNPDIATILGITESTVKKHVQEIFKKLHVETRGAATVRALEVLGSRSRRPRRSSAGSPARL